MAAYLLFDKCRAWPGLDGQPLPGGHVKFYQAGTTTPADVYAERALSTNNGDTVDLDASGRLEHECWADTTDAFFVEVYDSDDVKQGEVSYVEVPGGAQQSIPVPNEGEFITGDGTNFALATIREVPDPTGATGKILGNDGEVPLWVTKPSDGAAGTSDTSSSETGFTVGSWRFQSGTGSGTNSGGRTQTATITFPIAFSVAPKKIDIEVTSSSTASGGQNMPTHSIISRSATQFTVRFTQSELDDSGGIWDFNTAVQFEWSAQGKK